MSFTRQINATKDTPSKPVCLRKTSITCFHSFTVSRFHMDAQNHTCDMDVKAKHPRITKGIHEKVEGTERK